MTDHIIRDVASLEAIYGEVSLGAQHKEMPYLHPHYAALIKASPFAILATSGPGGLDASPRGDPPGFVEILDDKTLLLADRRGNNRLDSLRNVIADPHVALLFLVPGVGETLRVNGTAEISVAPELMQRLAVDGKPPRSVLVIHIDTVFFQCSRALVRSELWNPNRHVERASLPSPGQMLAATSEARIDGEAYDRELPERLKVTLY
ncbi:MAG TPA: pyridoxamine 5'-phosphate oxidase family protein [Devosia sp.]|jgi:hypothetical protein|uniref:pyridoxamine 5'-phosphate oxidase family protein n=1 Tax=Devosia sp. TaxID=1871048 RepID=UPI002DDCDBE1|nr:pyridoxamine 5'-phosphate oxidase family protein [Devosia sp.]HEV2517333.1 pyridoxamine 5'-phosphate oxidase family protein [Devosia sp.]